MTVMRDMQGDMNEDAPSFFDSLPVFTAFEGVTEASNYRPLPDDWALAIADIVDSTGAIRQGRYKSVNMAGASMISAVLNGTGRRDLPFVFGGDGAMVAFPLPLLDAVRAALATVRTWTDEELGLDMRTAIVPVSEIRLAGLDVRVARFRVSDHVSYAMFAGGGASWAEAQMKAGRYGVAAAAPGTRPDLSGLSCRWNPMESRHGEIVSIIAVPAEGGDPGAFDRLVGEIVELAGREERGGHPVPPDGPESGFIPAGLDAEAKAVAPKGRRLRRKILVLAQMWMVAVTGRLGLKIGPFDPRVYKRDVADNSDFRKFDDGLKMTIDVDRSVADRIEARLKQAEREGVCRFGMHRQNSALMTCMVATPMQRDHVHFIDGASGGYAVAAAMLKGQPAA